MLLSTTAGISANASIGAVVWLKPELFHSIPKLKTERQQNAASCPRFCSD